jgi:hypothetical protein
MLVSVIAGMSMNIGLLDEKLGHRSKKRIILLTL